MYNDPARKTLRQKVQTHPDGSKEYWRDVPNWKGFFRVSDLGRVKSLTRYVEYTKGKRCGTKKKIKGKIWKLKRVNKWGHRRVDLYRDGKSYSFLVHHIVLFAFVGPRPKGLQCRHLDGNPTNNRLDNLKWGTPKEDREDMKRHGRAFVPPRYVGEANNQARITDDQARWIQRMLNEGKHDKKELTEKFGLGRDYISAIINRKGRWKNFDAAEADKSEIQELRRRYLE